MAKKVTLDTLEAILNEVDKASYNKSRVISDIQNRDARQIIQDCSDYSLKHGIAGLGIAAGLGVAGAAGGIAAGLGGAAAGGGIAAGGAIAGGGLAAGGGTIMGIVGGGAAAAEGAAAGAAAGSAVPSVNDLIIADESGFKICRTAVKSYVVFSHCLYSLKLSASLTSFFGRQSQLY
ncbi:hypothetical protein [Ruminococcus flavefaciens]|uniref:hypothetical protein n=1 Tax=Ruminococcus flavefaciens TaxID=1265 RepID=UPI0026F11F49|nr:hypothetical protein [Ruminococcus flavefaciens]